MASMVLWSACAFLSTSRTLVSTNFAAFTVSLAATARECSILEINALMFFSFSPVDQVGHGLACAVRARLNNFRDDHHLGLVAGGEIQRAHVAPRG